MAHKPQKSVNEQLSLGSIYHHCTNGVYYNELSPIDLYDMQVIIKSANVYPSRGAAAKSVALCQYKSSCTRPTICVERMYHITASQDVSHQLTSLEAGCLREYDPSLG